MTCSAPWASRTRCTAAPRHPHEAAPSNWANMQRWLKPCGASDTACRPLRMTDPFVIASILAALCAFVAIACTRLRLRRARQEFKDEVSSWKMKLDLDLRNARKECDLLLDALGDAFLLVERMPACFANKAARTLFRGRDLTGRTAHEAFLDQRLAAALMRCPGHRRADRDARGARPTILTAGRSGTPRHECPGSSTPPGFPTARRTTPPPES